MLQRGAYGFLGRAYECDIPVSRVVIMAPETACEAWGAYPHAVTGQPVEVKYSREEDGYLLFAGTRLVREAQVRGDHYLPAFVEADAGDIGPSAILRQSNEGENR